MNLISATNYKYRLHKFKSDDIDKKQSSRLLINCLYYNLHNVINENWNPT